jgi:hypothetical protein
VIDIKRFERLPFGPSPLPDPLLRAGAPYVFMLLPSVEAIDVRSQRPYYRVLDDLPGRIHARDFALLYCSTGCGTFCEIGEHDIAFIQSIPVFVCRACNPVSTRRIGIQLHNFDKELSGHAPGSGKEGFVHTPKASSARSITRRNAKRELREFLDSNDPMLADGHQVKRDRMVDRECPEWVCNRFEFLNFLLQTFPKMLDKTSPQYRKHRDKAALWGGVLYHYFRQGLPASYVADLLSVRTERETKSGTIEVVEERIVTEAAVNRIVLAIRRRRAGLAVDGTKLTGKRGRPRLNQNADLTETIEVFDMTEVNP